MLAHDFEEEMVHLPCIVQPKLNGVRAKWDFINQCFISRSGKLIPELCIPHLYEKMKSVDGFDLDGELFCQGMPLQDIKGILTQSRLETAPNAAMIDFHIFDIIQSDYCYRRLDKMQELYGNTTIQIVNSYIADSHEMLKTMDRIILDKGYEGIMIRNRMGLYVEGRSWNLMKLKPLIRIQVQITGFIEGYGKFGGKLGAFLVQWDGKTFKIGGGNMSTAERKEWWEDRHQWLGKLIEIEYRELTIAGIPSQAQFKRFIT